MRSAVHRLSPLSLSGSDSGSLCLGVFVRQLLSGQFGVMKVFIHDATLLLGEERWGYISYPHRYLSSSPAQTPSLSIKHLSVSATDQSS